MTRNIKINILTFKKAFHINSIICLSLIMTMVSGCSSAQKLQKDNLIGTWFLNKIEIDGKKYFDRSDTTVTTNNYFGSVSDLYNVLSKDDSLQLIKKAYDNFSSHKSMAYRFTVDSVYFVNANVTYKGTYTFDFKKQKISCLFDTINPTTKIETVFHVTNQKLTIQTKDHVQEFVKASLN